MKVNLGDKLKIRFEGSKISTYYLRLPTSDQLNAISPDSPIGKALIGKKEGQKISIALNNRLIVFQILGIVERANNSI